jgi:AcrR family transcriptional regulator
MGIRSTPRRAERTAESRRLLLTAAREVFERCGYQAATMDQIADAAGFTKGALYSRFDSKADLFLVLFEGRIDQSVSELKVASGREASADEVFRRWLERTRAEPAWSLLVLEFRIAAARDPALLDKYAVLYERLVHAVAETVRRAGRDLGFVTEVPPVDLARVGLSFAAGVALERATSRAFSDRLAERGNSALFTALTRPEAIATRPRSRRARRRKKP